MEEVKENKGKKEEERSAIIKRMEGSFLIPWV
jgi:hypothetical protein